MTCREVIEFLMAYLDDELAPSQRAEFDEHMNVCPSCVRYLQTYQQTVRLGRQALAPTEDDASGRVPPGLLDAIRAARQGTGSKTGR